MSARLNQKTIFSGLRPTGMLHLGNYIGALQRWVNEYQEPQNTNLFCIVDLHALTTAQGEDITCNTLTVAACYLACGLSPEKSILFVQSHVPQHTQLAWTLGCHTPLGWLNRMTQFKEKSKGQQDKATLGLYAYPVLQAADVLLYNTTHVPVGEDQKQHIELVRDIAASINTFYQNDIFVLPEPMIGATGARIMSLRDGTQKMGKSDTSDIGRINLDDTPDMISQKIKRAKTDSGSLPETVAELEGRPEAKNLFTILSVLENTTLAQTVERFAGKNFSDLKQHMIPVMIAFLHPIQERLKQYLEAPDMLTNVLKHGAEAATTIAEPNLKRCYAYMRLS